MTETIRPDIQAIVDDIYNNVVPQWTQEERNEFFLHPYREDPFAGYHMTMGRWIRNHYNLWSFEWEPEMKDIMGCMCDCSPYHPDQLSSTIIEQVWLRGQPSGD